MKRVLGVVLILLVSQIGLMAQKSDFEFINYTEFFKLIEQEETDEFRLSQTIVTFDPYSDSLYWYIHNPSRRSEMRSDTIQITKKLFLANVHFEDRGAFCRFHFTENVVLVHCGSVIFDQCVFDGLFEIFTEPMAEMGMKLIREVSNSSTSGLSITTCRFNSDLGMVVQSRMEPLNLNVFIDNCELYPSDNTLKRFNLTVENTYSFTLSNNRFIGYESMYITSYSNEFFSMYGNTPDKGDLFLHIVKQRLTSNISIANNVWPEYVFLRTDALNSGVNIDWSQFENRIHSEIGMNEFDNWDGYRRKDPEEIDSLREAYVNSAIIENEYFYNLELRLLGQLADLYDAQHNSGSSNNVFVTLKDLETKRLNYLYEQDPNFDTYFQWRINSFLQIFSDYGTKPSKAIVFSLYVILLFGLFYLFTPNSWDTLNQNRLINRIRFFTKYFRVKDGIKEVYEEEKKEGIMNFEEFKQYMNESRKEVPRYFMMISKPLYYFSLSNYRLTTSVLSKIDILKGKWADLPIGRRRFSSTIMALGLFVMILFDLSIKVLNALILSVNTFTTLGFGEIPIKGVARYLAIIQGFIGWFMLSLFSVSLISQLMH